MGILKWFKNLKKKKKYSDDDYIRSTFIHVDANVNAFILFTFTDSYCKSATEFLSSTFINSIFMASSDDEYTDELDEDGNEIIISTPKNYLLIKVSCKDIFHILSNIDISNPFASEYCPLYKLINVFTSEMKDLKFLPSKMECKAQETSLSPIGLSGIPFLSNCRVKSSNIVPSLNS